MFIQYHKPRPATTSHDQEGATPGPFPWVVHGVAGSGANTTADRLAAHPGEPCPCEGSAGPQSYTARMFQEKSQAFLALPLKDAASISLADQIGEVLREQDIEPVMAADLSSSPEMAEQIQAAVRRAEVVVADLTGANPNVLFEVGLALGLAKPVLLLSQGPVKEVPSGLRTQQVAMYRPNDPATVRRYVELWLRDVRTRRKTAAY